MQDDELDEDTPEEEASLADDILDEVESDDTSESEEVEGFGHLGGDTDTATDEGESEDTTNEEEDGDESLEDDAEDVDYDTFDDIDEM